VTIDNVEIPWAFFYHERLTHWVLRLDPYAHEPLLLAARCQHIRRSAIPRTEFPPGVVGYKKWRSKLAQFHATLSAEILRDVGYDNPTIERVRDFLIKKNLKNNKEMQLFEDAICLVFLENEFLDFSEKHSEEKLIDILKKTCEKMTERGQTEAKQLFPKFPKPLKMVVEKVIQAK